MAYALRMGCTISCLLGVLLNCLLFEVPFNLVARADSFPFFISVSLKAKLSPSELFTLIMDVRRRVETDGTGSKLGARQVI